MDREAVKSLALEFLAGGVGVPGRQPEPPQVARGFADLAEEFGHLWGPRMVNGGSGAALFPASDRYTRLMSRKKTARQKRRLRAAGARSGGFRNEQVLSENRRARRNFVILEQFEAESRSAEPR